ncbi:SHS2 domain-containing protein [Alkalispirillum mobile]|uniref:SHS2 domain-containing protein n=2 Tax=Alkalispirillum mobile TaxID=85925 RepID=A0A498C6C4_9GAMM|nr:SHS2 domain-containing protein [Alkalispirillum mobile]
MGPGNRMQPTGWTLEPHDADVRVVGWGPTLAHAFEQAAVALTHVVTESCVAGREWLTVSCEAPDPELLLVEWLNQVIFEMAVGGLLFSRYRVVIEGEVLRATLWGEPVDRTRHAPACEPKGATYTALRVERVAGGGWVAGCVVDV